MTNADDVLFSEVAGPDGHVGVMTLNRPQVLNSLNHNMITLLHNKLKEWDQSDEIKAVVINAVEGRAFCAGGDLKLTYERAKEQHPQMTDFFKDEYELNKCIHHYPKPYIAFLDGITMGGGVGVSLHGSHRVATEKLMFAMPETGIGLFPDVGGTYFLPRLPGAIGTYLGLTGARLDHHDATYVGLTTAYVEHNKLSSLLEALAKTPFDVDAKQSVTNIISTFELDIGPAALKTHEAIINQCFAKNTVEEIIAELEKSDNEFAQKALSFLMKKSPTSLKVTLHALRQGEEMSFDDCMQQEFNMVTQFLKGHDFLEGIRAVIIDKDQSPKWSPVSLADVSEDDVLQYFSH